MVGYKQLCWTCKNACNFCECVWVETLDLTKCDSLEFKFDEEGFIKNCKKYVKEKPFAYFIKEKASKLGVTPQFYTKLLKEIKKYNLGITHEVLYKLKLEEKQEYEKEKKRALNFGISLAQFYSIRNYLKKTGSDLSVIDYCNKKQKYKK